MNAVAVRSLCEFAARTGSLDFRYTPSPSAQEGIKGHQTVQARRNKAFQAEYLLEGQFAGITLKGRADSYREVPALIEEIKTHRGDISRISEGQRQLHWAQLKLYGALLCQIKALPSIQLAVVYFEIGNEEETTFTETFDADCLFEYATRLCTQYRSWHEQELQHTKARNHALSGLKFPYPAFREHQRTLSEAVYKATCHQSHLLLEAPTGIGKTAGVIFPILKAMPSQQLDRIFALTCKTTGRKLILDTLDQLTANKTTPLRILELTARDKLCEHPELACHGESCPLAKGFFDRLPAARAQAVQSGWLDQTKIRSIALEHTICPYFLAQEMARWADIIVGDVNYYFDQQALLHALTLQNEWHSAVLVDEAHNLIDRARGMYSVTLNQQLFLDAAKTAPTALIKSIKAVQRGWQTMMRPFKSADTQHIDIDYHHFNEPPTELNGALLRLVSELTNYMSEHPVDAGLQTRLFDALNYLKLAEQFDQHSLCTLSFHRQGKRQQTRATLKLANLIPADFLAPRFHAAFSSVLFSATFTPFDYYRDLLGIPNNAFVKTIESPYHSDQLDVQRHAISTRLNDRANSLIQICDIIANRFYQHSGNYLVYLSSFSYLETLLAAFTDRYRDIAVRSQLRAMDETARQAFIDSFNTQRGFVGFAVLGGAFAEGIDLPGDRLIGVTVATLGLPPYDEFHQQLSQRLQARFNHGYEYTYLYPGLRKVVQAAGRVIRSPEDQGYVDLIDDRFFKSDVERLLPNWWTLTSRTKS